MLELLADKTGVVTRGASGNGRQIALAFARHEASVVVADVQEEPREGGAPTHEAIEDETDAHATYVECDVTDRDALDAAIEAAEEFGGVDVMVKRARLRLAASRSRSLTGTTQGPSAARGFWRSPRRSTTIDNERYRWVCFDPVDEDDSRIRFYRHTHEQTALSE